MKSFTFATSLLTAALSVAAAGLSFNTHASASAAEPSKAPRPDLAPLPIEPTGNVKTLPKDYPESWVFVDEASFMAMAAGKVILLDVAEDKAPRQIKAIADKNFLGNFTEAKNRDEFYIMESFHERGTRGPRTDVLAIYDKTTFNIIKEIVWKDTNRLQALPERYAMSVSADEKFLYVSNFDPAASITVIDLDSKEITATIGTPGCVLSYPTGQHSVTSICSNGGLLTTVLDANGQKQDQQRIEPFFDTDTSPVFERPAIINGMAYFPGFKGMMHSFDFSGEVAKYVDSWDMVTETEKATNWRPSGLALGDVDEQGLYYVIAHENGAEGTQTHGGTNVWVYDLKQQKRIHNYKLPSWGISVTATRGDKPLLVVTKEDMSLDILDAATGKLLRNINGFGNMTPLLVHKAH